MEDLLSIVYVTSPVYIPIGPPPPKNYHASRLRTSRLICRDFLFFAFFPQKSFQSSTVCNPTSEFHPNLQSGFSPTDRQSPNVESILSRLSRLAFLSLQDLCFTPPPPPPPPPPPRPHPPPPPPFRRFFRCGPSFQPNAVSVHFQPVFCPFFFVSAAGAFFSPRENAFPSTSPLVLE